MTTDLRPKNLGEILDRTFEIYRVRFYGFARISVMPALAMVLVRLANEFWWKVHPPDLALLFRVLNLGAPLYLLAFFNIRSTLQSLTYPSIARLVSNEYIDEGVVAASSPMRPRLGNL